MRSIILLPALLLAACSVSQDANNDSATVQYDENLAENTFDTVANEAGDIAGHIANDVEATGDKINNEIGDTDVDVDVNTNAN